MGQRHQQFIIVPNPKKHISNSDDFTLFNGRKKNVVLPLHNQWLYGRSTLILALNVLEHTNSLTKEEKTEYVMSGNGNTPFSVNGISNKFDTFKCYISSIEAMVNLIKEKHDSVNMGFHNSFFLGDEYKGMSENFTLGDNNDGITIIDTINNKYCFMNIYGDYGGELALSAMDLPSMQPMSAKDYVRAYYPEDKNLFPSHIDESEIDGRVAYNIIENKKLIDRFEDFDVLTESEIKKTFPKVYPKNSEGVNEGVNINI